MFNSNKNNFPYKHKYEIYNNRLYIIKKEYNNVTEKTELVKYKIPFKNEIKNLLKQ